MRKRILLLLLLIVPILVSAQRKNRYKYEWIVGTGVTNFFGELGGANQVGSHYLKDLNLNSTRPVFSVAFRYKKGRFAAAKASFCYGVLSGADDLTTERFRKNRNLSFRAPIVEISGQFEAYITKEKQGHLYRIKNARGVKNLQIYGFIGIGAIFFNPQAYYQNKWRNLQPLSTEGEGLPDGPAKYSRINFAIPVGFGVKYPIDKRLSIGLEYGLRKTFTDYLDDVSTEYYNPEVIRAAKGDVAAALADRSLGSANGGIDNQGFGPGYTRGNPKEKDSYMFTIVSLSYKVLYRRKSRSKF